jgi:hypothetical protein
MGGHLDGWDGLLGNEVTLPTVSWSEGNGKEGQRRGSQAEREGKVMEDLPTKGGGAFGYQFSLFAAASHARPVQMSAQ